MFASSCTVTGFRDWDLWGPFFFKPAKSPSRLDSAGSVLRQGFRVSGNPERLRSTADSFVQSLEVSHFGSDLREKGMRILLKKVWSVVELCPQTCNHNMPLTEQHKGERENNSVSYDHEPSFSEEGGDGDDLSMDGGSRRKFAALQRKSKWKFVFEVLFERGYHVSPQQCEDKFNDLNKRFKKLNDNRLNLHHDLALQHSVKLAFRNIDDQENDDFRNH
ncbi:hypothetical protein YC2023_052044 [Brassica napus]